MLQGNRDWEIVPCKRLMLCQTILDCSGPNEGFYIKCGYKRAGLEMAKYYNEQK